MKKSIFFFLVSSILKAQIVVSPLSLNLDHQNKIGNYLIKNNSNKPYEISISLNYGYAKTDTLGNLFFYYPDSIDNDRKFSCVEWINFFPKKILLQPNEKQIIRFSANPPRDLEYPFYFARISVFSQEAEPFKAAQSQGLTAKIKIAIKQNTSLIFQNRRVDEFFIVDTVLNIYKDQKILVVKLFNPKMIIYGGIAKLNLFEEQNMLFSFNSPLKVYASDYYLKFDLTEAVIQNILKAKWAQLEFSQDVEEGDMQQSKIIKLERFKPIYQLK